MQNHPPPPQDDGYPTNPPWTMFFDGPLYARYEEFMRGKDFSKILLQSKLKLANLHTSTESASMSSTSKDHDFWEFEPDTDPRPTKYPAGSDMYQCETDEYFRQIEEEERRRTRRTRACIWLTIVIMAALAFGTALVIHYFFIPSREDPKTNVNISLSGNTTMFAAGSTTPKVSSKDLSSEISRVLNVLKKEVLKDAKRDGTSTAANASTDGSLSTTPLDPLDFFGIDIYDSTTGSFLSSPLEVITSSGTETTRAPPAVSRTTMAPKSGAPKPTMGRATKAPKGGKAGVTSSTGINTTSKPADIVTDTTEQEKTKKILKAGPKVASKKGAKGTILKQNANKGATTKAPPAVKAKPQIKGTKKVVTSITTLATSTIVTTAAPTTAVPTTKAATTKAPKTKAPTTAATTTKAPPVETTEDYEYWYYTDDTTTHVPTPAVETNQPKPTTKVVTTSIKAATPTLGQTSASTASTKPTQQISSTILAKLTTLLTVPVRSTVQPKANATTVSAKTIATTAATTIKLPASSNVVKMTDVTSYTNETASIECVSEQAMHWTSIAIVSESTRRQIEVILFPSGKVKWSRYKTSRHDVEVNVTRNDDVIESQKIRIRLKIKHVLCTDGDVFVCSLGSKVKAGTTRSRLTVVGKPSNQVELILGPSVVEDRAFRVTAKWQAGYPIPWTNISWTALDHAGNIHTLTDFGEYRDYELHVDNKTCQTTLEHSLVVFPRLRLNDTTIIVKPDLAKKRYFVDATMEAYLQTVKPGQDSILIIPLNYCDISDGKDTTIPHPYDPCTRYVRCLPGDLVVQRCPTGTCFMSRAGSCVNKF